MHALVHDLRYALRRLRKSPFFTLLAAVTLGLGIGANAAVFSFVDTIVSKPFQVEEVGDLAQIYAFEEGGPMSHSPLAFPDYLDLREQSATMSDLAAYSFTTLLFDAGSGDVQGGEAGGGDVVLSELASGQYFDLLGVRAHLGRLLEPADDLPGSPQSVAVLSHRAFERRFGGDPAVLGETVRLNGHPFTVVGVAPRDFFGLTRGMSPELWIPIRKMREIRAHPITNSGTPTEGLHGLEDRARRWHWLVARLAPGQSFDSARAELEVLGSRLAEAHPETNAHRSFRLIPTTEIHVSPLVDGPLRAASVVVMGLVSLVLLIACANVANLLLAKAVDRQKEMATRLALGAGRWTIVRQLLTESLALAFLGGGFGVLIALASNRLVNALDLPLPVDLQLGVTFDLRVLAFTFGASLLTAVVFGLAPAFTTSHTRLASTLHDAARGSSLGRGRRRLQNGLVIAEVALALVLLVCAGLSIRSLHNARHVDPGFKVDGVVTASFPLNLQGYDDARSLDFYRQLRERLAARPEVGSVSFISHLPLTIENNMQSFATREHEALPPREWPSLEMAHVGPDYFQAIGIPLLAGRAIEERDLPGSPAVAVINQTLARTFWSGEEAIGQRFRLDGYPEPFEVIGVVRDAKYRTLGEDPRPFFYLSADQFELQSRQIVAAANGDPRLTTLAIREIARGLDPHLTLTNLGSLEAAISASLFLPRLTASLFGIFGAVGLVLAMAGLYGVIAYMVSRRIHEIGIRVALGARRGDVVRLVGRDALGLVGWGVALGLAGALGAARLLESVLYGLSATDPTTFAGVSLLLVAVAAVASLVPARRAAGVDPAVALRHE